jgi:hypothetical protein
MIRAEGISDAEFERYLEALRGKDAGYIYKESLGNLRLLKRPEQIRCIAWLCVLANSDGFMDRAEWQFIYKVYHKELKLPLDEIMEVQKQLAYSTRDSIFVRAVSQRASSATSHA